MAERRAVGSGSRGGVLVGSSGTESFQSRADQPSDPGRTSFVRSGGGGSSGGPTKEFLKAEAQRKAKIKAEKEKKIADEQKRITKLEKAFIGRGGQTRTQQLIDRTSGDRIKFDTTIDPRTKERVFTKTNVTTGKVTTKTFERTGKGSGVFQTGGLVTPPEKASERKPSTLTIAPNLREQFKEQVRLSTPKLSFLGKSQEAEFFRNVLGVIGGGAKFTKEKAIGKLTELKGADGKRIFTPNQARKTVELSAEVAKEFALGKGIGKATSLGRGAVSIITPKAIKGSATVKKITKVSDIAILGGLGAVETIRLNKVLKDEGEDAFIRELVGAASFGVGFSRTGLKPTAQAEQEFKNLAGVLKKTIPKGKRGQSGFQLLKKKKKVKRIRKDGTVELVEVSEQEVLSTIENKLIQQKDLKGQLKILAEIKKNLKTPVAKENFQKYVETLVDKQIVKLPKFDIVAPKIPGRKIISETPPRGAVVGEPFLGKLGSTSDIAQSSSLRIRTSEVPAGKFSKSLNIQKVQQAQQKSKALTLISQEKSKLDQLISQRVGTQIITRQRLKVEQALKSRQELLTKHQQQLKTLLAQRSALAQKSKLRLRLKIPQRLKQKLKQRLKTKFRRGRGRAKTKIFGKLIDLPSPLEEGALKKKRIKRLVPLPSRKAGYNVFVKSKGRLIRANVVPITKAKSFDLGSWIADRTTSKTFVVQKAGRVAKKPKIKTPRNYFATTQKKWRGKIKRGKEVPIKNKPIERTAFAIDTIGEKRQLSAFREIKRLKDSVIKRSKNKSPRFKVSRLIKGRKK